MSGLKFLLVAGSIAVLLAAPAQAAAPDGINWNVIPSKTLLLFYPAQSTYEWLRSSAHGGHRDVLEGAACLGCHADNDEENLGPSLVVKPQLEPTPLAGKNGVIKMRIQVAYNKQNAYFRIQWKTTNPKPGTEHQYLRFDGKQWTVWGYPRLDKAVREGKQPAIHEDRLSMMIDDGAVPEFAKQGCWVACHDGQPNTSKEPSIGEVHATDLYRLLGKKDVRKYLPQTRSDKKASWDKVKTAEEIAKLKADGVFLDLIQWHANRSNPVGMADDGYVLEWRYDDDGQGPYISNIDSGTNQPRYMWDTKKVGYKSATAGQLRKGAHNLIREQNALPFSSDAGWKAGDMVPAYVVSGVDAKGSAADNHQVKGAWKKGMWTVIWERPLNLMNSDDKALKPGKAYTFAFAIHDDNTASRGHHVSFPMTIGFGAPAALEASEVN